MGNHRAIPRIYLPALGLLGTGAILCAMCPSANAATITSKNRKPATAVKPRVQFVKSPLPAMQTQPVAATDFKPASGAVLKPVAAIDPAPVAVQPATPSVAVISENDKKVALRVINYYRQLAHLDNISWSDAISTGAYRHSRYRAANPGIKESPHHETPGLPEFSGAEFWDRVKAAGFPGFAFGEGMSMQVVEAPDPAKVVTSLIDVPYHRMPFLAYGPIAVGIGKYQTVWTFDFAGKTAPVSVWPAPDATGVPLLGNTKDSPDPMRIHGVSGDGAGYVITAQFNQMGFHFDEATLTDAGGVAVKCYVNHPQNDNFCLTSVIMIPAAKLTPNTKYNCHIAITSSKGVKTVKDWSFTTGDDTHNFDVALQSGKVLASD
jgi:uncharacterized protein YkwD